MPTSFRNTAYPPKEAGRPCKVVGKVCILEAEKHMSHPGPSSWWFCDPGQINQSFC